jgi:hypothetical protein
MTERNSTITISRERLEELHQGERAALYLRDELIYLTVIFNDMPEVSEKIQNLLDTHKKASAIIQNLVIVK